MANKKITELNAATTLAATDVVPVVDVSADETKKITATDLFRTLPDGTAAAPALAFSSDQANGVYLAGTDTVGISTGGTQRVTVDGSGNVTISGDLTVRVRPQRLKARPSRLTTRTSNWALLHHLATPLPMVAASR